MIKPNPSNEKKGQVKLAKSSTKAFCNKNRKTQFFGYSAKQ